MVRSLILLIRIYGWTRAWGIQIEDEEEASPNMESVGLPMLENWELEPNNISDAYVQVLYNRQTGYRQIHPVNRRNAPKRDILYHSDSDDDQPPDLIPDSDSEDDETDKDVAAMSNWDHQDLDPESDSDSDQAGGAGAVSSQDLSQSDVLEESLVEPWTSYVPNAPEDEETPLPCSFPEFLAFTEVGYETALQTYLDLLGSHVFPEFQKATDIMGLLRTKGVKVFVPQNWEGVRVQPLHIVFIEGMPTLMKPRARPVNPKLFEHAHKEFLRLLTYMYVHCDGPVACPLVIAPKATAPFIRFCGDYTPINKFIPHWHTPMKNPQQTIADELVHHDAYGDADMSNAYHQLPMMRKRLLSFPFRHPVGK